VAKGARAIAPWHVGSSTRGPDAGVGSAEWSMLVVQDAVRDAPAAWRPTGFLEVEWVNYSPSIWAYECDVPTGLWFVRAKAVRSWGAGPVFRKSRRCWWRCDLHRGKWRVREHAVQEAKGPGMGGES